jgi:hypothetical protein
MERALFSVLHIRYSSYEKQEWLLNLANLPALEHRIKVLDSLLSKLDSPKTPLNYIIFYSQYPHMNSSLLVNHG